MAATLPARLIIDTGPLVAWLDAADRHHAPVRDLLAEFQGELISTWPVLTEVCHLVPERLVPGFLRWVGAGGLMVVDISTTSAPALADRMDKYADLPMDLADASLLWLAETLGSLDILTLDRRDFGVYRTLRGQALRNVLDAPVRAKPRAQRRSAR
ncbi:PIN domain-containing protein [Aquabacterium sp.]|uniref:PIN domain-containing protein n=1 Tax=Aquabacterium sp. TaxID=1872578 RepID=UPI002BAC5D55|nr:PIN domain-containing protein [Aquabacterium sp.]HSW06442.1 PIN domain-containing protein [Aquabacterium sp.]